MRLLMKLRVFGRLAPALAALLAVLLPGGAVAADLGIAFVGGLSGVHADAAQDQLDGFLLGVKHLGGRLGGVEIAVSVIDDHRNPEKARETLASHLQIERPEFVLLGSEAPVTAAVAPIAIAAKAIVISLSPLPASFAGRDCQARFFSLAGLVDTTHEMAGEYLQGQGFHRLVVAGRHEAATDEALAAFRRGFNGEVTFVAGRHGNMDFTEDLRRIRKLAPEGVYLLHSGGMAVNFIQQFARDGLKQDIPLFGPYSSFDQPLIAAAGPAVLGAFSVGPWSEDLDIPVNRRMVSDFETEYGRLASVNTARGYDAAMLLDAAVRAVDKKVHDDDLIRAALRRVDFPSVRGVLRFDTNQFPIQTYLVRHVVADSRDRMINEQRGVLMRDVRDGHAGECPMRWTVETPPKG
ncbi:MAG TPA: ABC transporter substrate-binding protein [Rhodospirillaceae bacterium]|nr:ABC transporter substrate-binding protein [Rhodospirillaceae bacterium]